MHEVKDKETNETLEKLLRLSRDEATPYGLYLLGFSEAIKVGATRIEPVDARNATERLAAAN